MSLLALILSKKLGLVFKQQKRKKNQMNQIAHNIEHDISWGGHLK
jgi:hypothetical protein